MRNQRQEAQQNIPLQQRVLIYHKKNPENTIVDTNSTNIPDTNNIAK